MMVRKGAMFIRVRTVFLFWLLIQPSTSLSLDPEKTVVVENGLEGGQDLFFHCKSSDSDLGVQQLHLNGTFRWRFRVNLFETTLFHCIFQWEGASHSFVIYKAKRDQYICNVCSWIVKEEGPCMYFPGNLNCYNWYS
ncbi:hypothetical protein VNO80_25312 [Phaseolus coccineus]|uniref:S-protein homolog n=1 Tax=Phaseolus coccineus TaxID=3886 RepID=A0AAN9QNV7_PHACN